jgi:hypothetical protein
MKLSMWSEFSSDMQLPELNWKTFFAPLNSFQHTPVSRSINVNLVNQRSFLFQPAGLLKRFGDYPLQLAVGTSKFIRGPFLHRFENLLIHS